MAVILTKNFTLDELVASTVAANFHLDNTPSQQVIVNLTILAQKVLQPVRDLWGKSVFVSSGYRSPLVNIKVGGQPNSQHITGEAADISVGSKDDNKKLFNKIVSSTIPFDQLIDESNYQ